MNNSIGLFQICYRWLEIISHFCWIKLCKGAAVLPRWCRHLYYSVFWRSAYGWRLQFATEKRSIWVIYFRRQWFSFDNRIKLVKFTSFLIFQWIHFQWCEKSLICGLKFHAFKCWWSNISGCRMVIWSIRC